MRTFVAGVISIFVFAKRLSETFWRSQLVEHRVEHLVEHESPGGNLALGLVRIPNRVT